MIEDFSRRSARHPFFGGGDSAADKHFHPDIQWFFHPSLQLLFQPISLCFPHTVITMIRQAPRHLLRRSLPLRLASARRFLSTAPPAQKSRTWKSTVIRWGLAGATVYYYNTSNLFAEEPPCTSSCRVATTNHS